MYQQGQSDYTEISILFPIKTVRCYALILIIASYISSYFIRNLVFCYETFLRALGGFIFFYHKARKAGAMVAKRYMYLSLV